MNYNVQPFKMHVYWRCETEWSVPRTVIHYFQGSLTFWAKYKLRATKKCSVLEIECMTVFLTDCAPVGR